MEKQIDRKRKEAIGKTYMEKTIGYAGTALLNRVYPHSTRHTPEMIADLSRRAYEYREQVLRMIYERKSGHLGGAFSADTFETGTRAAAWGGTTTIVDFAVQAKGTSLLATLDKWHAKADGNCAIDYGFHMIVSDVNDATLKEMDACISAGVNSF